MVLNLTGISYFAPLFSFVLVLVIMFAILKKTKILGESNAIVSIVSVILALIFVSVADVRVFVEQVTPWFAVLILGLFFLMTFAYFALKEPDKFMKPWIVWVFAVILVLFFLVRGYHIFSVGSNPDYISVKNWISDGRVAGSLWLVLFAAITIFAVTKKAGK